MPKFLLISFSLLLFTLSVLPAQDNPFFSNNKSKEDAAAVKQETPAPRYPVFIQQWLTALNGIQRELNNRLSSLIRQIVEKQDPFTLFSLLVIAFLYGVIHALGPGHGKIIITSYAISNPLKARQGIALGVFISVIHTLSAIILVVTIYFLLKVSFIKYATEPKQVIALISYSLFILMGCYLLIKGIWAFRRKKAACGCAAHTEPVAASRLKHLFLPALAIGIIPCDGTILLLVFAISVQALWIGILLAVVMSVGMALTISLIGLITIGSKRGSLKIIAGKEGKKDRRRLLNFILETAGSVFIILMGLILLFSNLIN